MPDREVAQAPSMARGPIAMLVTTFDPAGEIDLASMVGQARYAVASGARGIALFGLAGEGFKLDQREREAITSAVAPVAVAGQVPLIAAADHGGTRVAAAMASALVARGATQIMAMPPAGATSADLVRAHLLAVAEAAGTPVILQDAPHASHVTLTADAIGDLVRSVPSLRGVKVESPPTPVKMAALRRSLGDAVTLYGGRGGIAFLPELLAGADGTMVGPCAIDPLAQVQRSWRAGRMPEARRHMADAAQCAALAEGNDLYAQMHKHQLHRLGVIAAATMRAPSVPVPGWLREEWSACTPRPPTQWRTDPPDQEPPDR